MSKFRILLVDDEDDVRTIQRLAMTPKYEIVEAHDGLDALEKLERAEPDFVILDVMMPLMDGFQTCQAIRRHPKFGDMPVLFLSAKRAKEAIKKGYGAGANLYLTKPFEPDRLAKNVEYYLQESGATPRPKRYTIEQLTSPGAQEDSAPAVAAGRAKAAAPAEAKPPRPAGAQAVAPDAETPFGPPRPRAMIVEDDTDLLELLSVTLSGEFEITSARDGIEAAEKIVLYQPDLVVLDAMLPKMSGYQLCASLRRNQNYRTTPILFVSAKSSPRDQEYCRRLGADDFIGKPFDPNVLRQRLLSFATAPGFEVRPKKLTLEQIQAREKGDVQWLEERERHLKERRRTSELGRFIDREMPP